MYLLSFDFQSASDVEEFAAEKNIPLSIICPTNYESMTELRIGWNGIIFGEARSTSDICSDTFYPYDCSWKNITELIKIEMENGEVERNWDVERFPDGIYFKNKDEFFKALNHVMKITINLEKIMEYIMKW